MSAANADHTSPGLVSLATLLQTLLTQAMRLNDANDANGALFASLEDHVIGVQLKETQHPLYFIFTQYGVSVQTQLIGEPDAILRTGFIDLLNNKPIEILAGDELLAQNFIDALRGIEIDWEEQLSHLTGDLVAFKVGQGVRAFLTQSNTTQDHLRNHLTNHLGQTIKEYLHFELNALPTQAQVTRFTQSNQQTAQAVDVLSDRIERLLERLTAPNLKESH